MKLEQKNNRHIVNTDRCVENIGNRFDLVLVASQRVRELKKGYKKLTAGEDGSIISALKEIEEGHIGRDLLKKIK